MATRPSYRRAVEWVALNDNAGGPGAYDHAVVRDYLTVGFVADLFGKDQERVAQDVIDYRAEVRQDEVDAIDAKMLRNAR